MKASYEISEKGKAFALVAWSGQQMMKSFALFKVWRNCIIKRLLLAFFFFWKLLRVTIETSRRYKAPTKFEEKWKITLPSFLWRNLPLTWPWRKRFWRSMSLYFWSFYSDFYIKRRSWGKSFWNYTSKILCFVDLKLLYPFKLNVSILL